MNKDAQNSINEGSPNQAKKGTFFPRDLWCSEFLFWNLESNALSQ